MNQVFALAVSGLLLSSAAAMAQTPAATPTQPSKPPGTAAMPLRQEMTDSLKQAGFTDVKVVPDSFFVQAKDKSGNPVAMLIGPNSMTELVDAKVQGGKQAAAGTAPGTPGSQGGQFVSDASGDVLSSKLIGTDVHDTANQDIGTIKDVAMKGGLVQAYIVSVGGFLGMGDHYVAVSPQSLTLNYDANSGTAHATMNTTQAQLRAAPAFQYANG